MGRSDIWESLKLCCDDVLTDEASLDKYAAGLSGTSVRPAAIVFPQTVEEIINIVKKAVEFEFKLYPISRGKNFGYGSAQATTDGQVIIDLSKMNQILEVNEQLGYAKLQPGVSQQQLYEYLQNTNSTLQMDVTGAGSDASVIGNILERGFGHTQYGNRYRHFVNLSVVLPDGSLIKTSFSGYEKCDTKNTFRYAPGPLIEGLFTQSNFGIVSEMTLELMRKPEKLSMFIFTTKDEEAIKILPDVVRELKLNNVVESAVHIANKARAAGEKEKSMAGAWNMSGALVGPKELVSAKKKIIKKTFRKKFKNYRLFFFNESRIKKIIWLSRRVKFLPSASELISAFDLVTGKPTDDPLKILINNNEIKSSDDLSEKSEKYFKWVNAVCRAEATSVVKCLTLQEKIFHKFNYEFRVTLTAINARNFVVISNISYNKTEEEIIKAKEFYQVCSQKLINEGFFPYRSGTGSYHTLPEREEATQNFFRNLKKMLDPGNIIAPGKYNI